MDARVITDQKSLEKVVELLRVNSLPYEDIRHSDNLFVSYHDQTGTMVGSGGLEFYSNYALLRSVAVEQCMRGKSIGKEIVNNLLDRLKTRGTHEVYLLTETAREFFLKMGFSEIERDAVPLEIKLSSEFSSVCPVSAAVMVRRIA